MLQILSLSFTFSISLCLCSIVSISVDSSGSIFHSLIFIVAVSNLLFNLSNELNLTILFLEVRFAPSLLLAHSFSNVTLLNLLLCAYIVLEVLEALEDLNGGEYD